MSRGTASEAAVLTAYQRAEGCSRRTAQRRRAANAPSWRQFLLTHGMKSSVSEGKIVCRKLSALAKARREEEGAASMLGRLQHASESAVGLDLVAYANAVSKAQERWARAVRILRDEETAAGLLVPIATIRKLQREMIVPMGNMFAAMRGNIAAHLKPEVRVDFYRAWQTEWDPVERQLRAIDADLEKLLVERD